MLSRNILLLAQRLDFCKTIQRCGIKEETLGVAVVIGVDVLHKILLRRVFRRGAGVVPGRFAYVA